MRTTTTIALRDDLLAEIRQQAKESGQSAARLIEDVLAKTFQHPEVEKKHSPDLERRAFRLVTFGDGGHFTELNVDSNAELYEAEDLERYLGRPK